MNEEVYKLLGNKNLSRTPCRVDVLKTLLESGSALSENEIRNKLSSSFDRTTVYRTLRSFLDQDVIHSISLEGGEVRYAVTRPKYRTTGHFHVHFFCDNCNNVYCLPNPEFNPPDIPEGFTARGYDLIINGKCNGCNQ